MKADKIKILGLAALLYFGVLRGAKAIVAGIESWGYNSMDFGNGVLNMNINLRINNPLLVGLTITGVRGDVYLNGVKAGYVDNRGEFYLPARKMSIFPIVISVSLGDLSRSLLTSLQTGARDMVVAFNGDIYVNNIAIPIQSDYKVNK